MTVRNSLRGRRNKAAGDSCEAWVEAQHDMAKRLGALAHVVHNEPHAKYIRGRLIYTSAGVADYTGILNNGTYVAIECKSTSKDALPRAAIKPMQARHLDAVAKAGGVALLLVEFRGRALSKFAIPWDKVPWTTKRTAESLSFDAELLYPWTIYPDECYLSGLGGP